MERRGVFFSRRERWEGEIWGGGGAFGEIFGTFDPKNVGTRSIYIYIYIYFFFFCMCACMQRVRQCRRVFICATATRCWRSFRATHAEAWLRADLGNEMLGIHFLSWVPVWAFDCQFCPTKCRFAQLSASELCFKYYCSMFGLWFSLPLCSVLGYRGGEGNREFPLWILCVPLTPITPESGPLTPSPLRQSAHRVVWLFWDILGLQASVHFARPSCMKPIVFCPRSYWEYFVYPRVSNCPPGFHSHHKNWGSEDSGVNLSWLNFVQRLFRGLSDLFGVIDFQDFLFGLCWKWRFPC